MWPSERLAAIVPTLLQCPNTHRSPQLLGCIPNPVLHIWSHWPYASSPLLQRLQTLLSHSLQVNYLRLYNYIYIWDSFRQNGPSYIYIKCYKNASLLNCYIFRTVNAINFQFSTLHTTPFPYGKIYFGVLHLLRASIATFDTPSGSNPP